MSNDEVSLLKLQRSVLERELAFLHKENEALKNRYAFSRQQGDFYSSSFSYRSLDFVSASKVSVVGHYYTEGYKDLHLEVENFKMADGTVYDRLICKLVDRSGVVGIEFRPNGLVTGRGLSLWSQTTVDYYGQCILLLGNPGPGDKSQQERIKQSLKTFDRQFICGVVTAIRDCFFTNNIFAPNLDKTEMYFWKRVVSRLYEFLLEDQSFVSYDDVDIVEEMVLDGYSHLWLKLTNLQFRKRVFPSFDFKLGVVRNKKGSSELLYEFRELNTGEAPLEVWPPSAQDEFGCKFVCTLRADSKSVVISPSEAPSEADSSLLVALTKTLPKVISFLESRKISFKNNSDFWGSQVSSFDQLPVDVQRKNKFIGKVKRKVAL